jgi:hypothetical protein
LNKPGAQSPATRIAKLDGRTQLAKRAKKLRADLIDHVGGNPSTVQLALIEQAVGLQPRCALLDSKTFNEGIELGDGDQRRYLAWANSLQRLMRQLGQKRAPKPAMSLADHLAQRAGG